MNEPDKSKIEKIRFEPKEGQRRLLSGDKVLNRCPSLDFNPNDPLISKEMALDYLSSILVRIFLAQQKHEQKSSNILSGLDKGTSR